MIRNRNGKEAGVIFEIGKKETFADNRSSEINIRTNKIVKELKWTRISGICCTMKAVYKRILKI